MAVMTDTFLFAGMVVGFSIAVPIGPMGLLCIQRTLTSGMRAGLCTGLGAATVNVLYGLLVISGFNSLTPVLAGTGQALNLLGGLFLLWSAARTFVRRHDRVSTARSAAATISTRAAFGSGVAFNIMNPMSPMLILALLSPSLNAHSPAFEEAVALLAGIFLAASSWWIILTGGVSLLRARLSPTMLIMVNRIASALLTVYGTLALARVAGF